MADKDFDYGLPTPGMLGSNPSGCNVALAPLD
jgi:hypothetical protein